MGGDSDLIIFFSVHIALLIGCCSILWCSVICGRANCLCHPNAHEGVRQCCSCSSQRDDEHDIEDDAQFQAAAPTEEFEIENDAQFQEEAPTEESKSFCACFSCGCGEENDIENDTQFQAEGTTEQSRGFCACFSCGRDEENDIQDDAQFQAGAPTEESRGFCACFSCGCGEENNIENDTQFQAEGTTEQSRGFCACFSCGRDEENYIEDDAQFQAAAPTEENAGYCACFSCGRDEENDIEDDAQFQAAASAEESEVFSGIRAYMGNTGNNSAASYELGSEDENEENEERCWANFCGCCRSNEAGEIDTQFETDSVREAFELHRQGTNQSNNNEDTGTCACCNCFSSCLENEGEQTNFEAGAEDIENEDNQENWCATCFTCCGEEQTGQTLIETEGGVPTEDDQAKCCANCFSCCGKEEIVINVEINNQNENGEVIDETVEVSFDENWNT